MLLHVRQHAGKVATAPFPAATGAALATLTEQSAALAAAAPGSRRMELRAAARPA
jgi:hypothetical protein